MKDRFILFYMDGCHYCDLFKPTWDRLEKNHSNKYDFTRYESNELEKSKDIENIKKQLNLSIDGFPSIFCKVKDKYYKYDGNREEEDLLKFIESKNNGIKFYYFYMDGCNWCKEFTDVWNEIKKIFDYYECERSNIKESKEANEIQEKLNINIKTFPAIFIEINGTYYKYDGDRTLENILKFIDTNRIQKGGSDKYRYKYKKYKHMYFEILDKYNKLKLEKKH